MNVTAARPNVLLVYVDAQGDFVFRVGVLPVAGAQEMVGALGAYLATLDPTEIAAFLATFDTHTPEDYLGSAENLGDEAAGIPGFEIHCEKGKPGWESVVNMRIPHALGIPVYKIEKDVFDVFRKPGFVVERLYGSEPVRQREAFLERMRALGVDTVRIAGFAADYCVNWAIQGFLAAGFKVQVVEHLTAGIGMDIRATAERFFPGRVEFL